ncbi:MAG: hypothetical protein WCP85_17825 [Mariniphaga sp.]
MKNDKKSDAIGQQAVTQLLNWRIKHMFKIPWGHHNAIISKGKTAPEGLYDISNTINHAWSRTVNRVAKQTNRRGGMLGCLMGWSNK